MSRLTKKYEDNSGYHPIKNHPIKKEITLFDFELDDYDCCIKKLGKLEDLMEEYGIKNIEGLENIIIAFRVLVDKNRGRDISKKPLIKKYANSEHYLCPNCQGRRFGIIDYGEYKNEWRKGSELMPYCPQCGQKLDWSEQNG